MQRLPRPLFTVLASLLFFILLWPPGLRYFKASSQVIGAEQYFREVYDLAGNAGPAIHPDDWAGHFAGRAGLKTLQRLSMDQEISPSGRRRAAQMHQYINNGDHLEAFRDRLKRDDLSWTSLDFQYFRFLYWFDSLVGKRP